MSKFYTFNQNNSGGSFVFDKEKGLSHFVLIEADSVEEAANKAEEIGIYFDGISLGYDCECCGDRWNYPSNHTAYDQPQIYDQIITNKYKTNFSWMEPNPEGFIHYKNKTIKPIFTEKENNNV